MKWTVRQEKLIRMVIRHERKCLKTRGHKKFWTSNNCAFCNDYFDSKISDCADCPNKILNELLKIKEEGDTACWDNMNFLTFELMNLDSLLSIRKSNIIKLRIQWWKDALKMTEGQFIKKYKGESK